MFAGIAGALVRGGYDAVIVNKPFDFPILHWARQSDARRRCFAPAGRISSWRPPVTTRSQYWVSPAS